MKVEGVQRKIFKSSFVPKTVVVVTVGNTDDYPWEGNKHYLFMRGKTRKPRQAGLGV